MIEDLHVLPVANRRLIYSPRRGVAAVVSPAAVTSLTAWAETADGVSPQAIAGGLAPLVEALSVPPRMPERAPWPPFLGLIVTRDCTMACRYCDFGGKETALGPMPPDIAVAAIDGWAEQLHRLGATELNLHFFGGEPFFVPDLVQVAVHRTRTLAATHGLRTHFEASTNGQLDDATLDFAADYFDTLVFSVDGMEPDQNRHRPLANGHGSFQQVHAALKRLRDSPVEICLRCCISAANVGHMAAIAEWFVDEYRPSVIDFEPMQLFGGCRAGGLELADPGAFAQGFLAARRKIRAAGVECVYSTLHDSSKVGFCPVDQQAYLVAPNGRVRCCYLPAERWQDLGLDLEIGRAGADGQFAIDPSSLHRVAGLSAEQPVCRTCFCRAGCGGGCLLQDKGPADAAGYTGVCRHNRLIQAGVLLDDLGQQELADELLSNPAYREALLRQPDDRLGQGTVKT